MFDAVVDISKAALKKYTHLSIFFFFGKIVVSYGLYTVSKNLFFFHLRCLSQFFKSISAGEISPGSQLSEKPWGMLTVKELYFNQVTCISMSTKLCIWSNLSVVPFDLVP